MITKKNRIIKLIAVLLAAVFGAVPAVSAGAESIAEQTSVYAHTAHAVVHIAESEQFTMVPQPSEGVTIVLPDNAALTVTGRHAGNSIVFDETKTLTFIAEFSEGWTFCRTYSVFFPGDARAAVTENADGTVTFAFSAVAGENVAVSDFYGVAVNASAAELPELRIDTEIPFSDITKLEWVDAHFTLTLGTKPFESGDYEGDGKVKGRGNSSWTYPKKPYSIKLNSKASLLDIPKTKKYAIIANYQDSSYLRNYITYKTFLGLLGIGYVPKCEFVDVYLNGEYNGLYLLTERIDIEKSKVNIEEADADHLSGGYLIEKDAYGKVDFDNDLWFNCPYWANQSKDYFVLKAPEPEDTDLQLAMKSYLEEYMQRIHDCLINGSGEPYTEYVDPATWIDFMIVQEVSKNIDGCMKTSCFMYKDRDDEHLYMTAPWDFDFAYGLVSWTNNSPDHNDGDCPPGNTPDGFIAINSAAPWLKAVYYNNEEFRWALKTRYTEYRRTFLDEMLPMINEQAAYISISQAADGALWNRNFSYGIRKLRSFLEGRLEWLDSQWLLADGEVDLDYALNLYGGTLEFQIDGEGGTAPFIGVVRDGAAMAMADGTEERSFRLNRSLEKGEILAFDYSLTGGSLRLIVNGAAIALPEHAELGRYVFTAPHDGEYEFVWSAEGGVAFVDNVSIDLGLLFGDANMDGTVNVIDALFVLRAALGVLDLGDGALICDMNADGTIGVADAILLLRRTMLA
ncbi:MAG: CotH kinase family protein [Clostridia bacterium]|nr:CotH kinase family protein [Clostridia bacterium]